MNTKIRIFFASAIFFVFASAFAAEESEDYILDYGTITTGAELSNSEDYFLDAGFTSFSARGEGDVYIEESIHFFGCGDRKKNGDEICDGSDFGGLSCQDYGFAAGSLRCSDTCDEIFSDECHDVGGSRDEVQGDIHYFSRIADKNKDGILHPTAPEEETEEENFEPEFVSPEFDAEFLKSLHLVDGEILPSPPPPTIISPDFSREDTGQSYFEETSPSLNSEEFPKESVEGEKILESFPTSEEGLKPAAPSPPKQGEKCFLFIFLSLFFLFVIGYFLQKIQEKDVRSQRKISKK